MEHLEQRIKEFEDRNKRVELDKAWEVSWTRRGILMVFTYMTIGAYLYAIEVPRPWINAIVPAVAFMISTMTMPYFKRKWIERSEQK